MGIMSGGKIKCRQGQIGMRAQNSTFHRRVRFLPDAYAATLVKGKKQTASYDHLILR
jgi:hypothetical protein